MANYTANTTKTITLVSGQVDTITLSGVGTTIRVQSNSTTVPVSFAVAQPGGTPATPTDKGDDCYVVMSAYDAFDLPWSGNGAVVKVIATGTPIVSISLI
jgi:hypothetical protein